MGAAEEGKRVVVKALKAEADAVDACASEVGEAGGLRAVGIGLEGDLKILRDRPITARCSDNRLDRRSLHQGRRSAAKKNGR